MKKKIKLSVIVLSYNTKTILRQCLESLCQSEGREEYQIIVVDNASTDSSAEMVKNDFGGDVELIVNPKNLGFARGNNVARNKCQGRYVLFLNSDVILEKDTIQKTLGYMDKNPKVGALSCQLVLQNGQLDKDTRRSFPTPGVAFSHFLKLDQVFSGSKIFDRYWYGFRSANETHEVDAIQGAYFLTKKSVLEAVDWFDEEYFLDGEDIDLCWKIKAKGGQIVYYPQARALHLKGASKGKGKAAKKSFSERKKFISQGVRSMEIFYQKRLAKKYPVATNLLVGWGIKLMAFLRILGLRIKYLL